MSNPAAPQSSEEIRAVQDRFILEWGRMSSSWGINRTMAQIHALLLITGKAHSMDEIIERLHISRGNASMNLRDLIDWGIIQRFRKPGDRKDIYQAQGDVVQMFAMVIRERKRREFDPTVAALRDCLGRVPEDPDTDCEVQTMRARMAALLEIFEVIDRVYQQVFTSDDSFRETISLFASEKEDEGR